MTGNTELPRNLELLRDLLIDGRRRSADECAEMLSAQGVVLGPDRILRFCGRFTDVFLVEGETVGLASAAPAESQTEPDEDHAGSTSGAWRTLPDPVPAASVSVGGVVDDEIKIVALSQTRADGPEVVLIHPGDRDAFRETHPGKVTADLALLAVLAHPDVRSQELADLVVEIETRHPETTGEFPAERVARACLEEVQSTATWALVGRSLAAGNDPLAHVVTVSAPYEELRHAIVRAPDPLLRSNGAASSGPAVDFVLQGLARLREEGFSERSSQKEMATLVAASMDESRHVAVEAPTGTGKSFAYLLAAAGAARNTSRPVIVATHTRVLQGQLRRDAERLRALGLLPVPFRQIQGVANYACAREVADAYEEGDWEPDEWRALAVALRVLAATPTGVWSGVGDSALRRNGTYRRMRHTLRTDAAGCERTRCEWASSCPLMAKSAGMDEQPGIISLNHALLGAWVKQADEAGEGGQKILQSGVSSMVFDEAHTLEDSLTSSWTEETGSTTLTLLGIRLQSRRGPVRAVREAVRHLNRSVGSSIDVRALLAPVHAARRALMDTLEPLEAAAVTYAVEFGGELSEVTLDPRLIQARQEYRQLASAAFATTHALAALRSAVATVAASLTPDAGEEASAAEDGEAQAITPARSSKTTKAVNRALFRLRAMLEVITEQFDLLTGLRTLPEPSDWVHLLRADKTDPDNPTWVYQRVPVTIGEHFRRYIVARARSVALTSATLTVGEQWQFLSDRLHIAIEAGNDTGGVFEGRTVDSPFNHAEQASLVLTSHLPLPTPSSEEAFVEEVASDQIGFLSLTGGRALTLFAARKRMEAVAELVDRRSADLADRGVTILMQGREAQNEIALRFREDDGTVVFGLRSYWEGFDAPGSTLSYLIVEKPPYPHVNDPLVKARQRVLDEQGRDSFLEYVVPLAAIQFAQGVGRLIRDEKDRGAILVLDRRMQYPGPHNNILLQTLPEMNVHYATTREDAWTHAIEFVDGAPPDISTALTSASDDLALLLADLRVRLSSDPEGVLREAAREIFGIDELRDAQVALMVAVLENRDALGLMPTGSGKSICFQLPALVRPDAKPTVVISPLIALIKDQVDELRSRRRLREVVGITGRTSASERTSILRDLAAGQVRLLYVSPERLVRDPVLQRALAEPQLAALVVDEAHCVSVWGHDFRPEFRQIPSAVSSFARSSRLGLTATATPAVREDIGATLELSQPQIVSEPQDRPNLRFVVTEVGKETDRARALLRFVTYQSGRPEGERGIVYVSRRSTAEEVAFLLRAAGMRARHYHAGMVPEQRESVQEQFMSDLVQIIVATKAFGMGINKSDIGWVAHYDLPESLEAYAQEAGRAARDRTLTGDCLLLFTKRDIARRRGMQQQSTWTDVAARGKRVLQAIAQCPTRAGDAIFDPEELCETLRMSPDELNVTLAWLERADALERRPDCTLRGTLSVGHRQPEDPQERSLYRQLVWDLLNVKVSQTRRIDLAEVATRAGHDPDELEAKLVEWSLQSLVTFNSSARLWRCRVHTVTVDEERFRKEVEGWHDWQERRLQAMVRYATQLRACRRVLIGKHFGDDVASCHERSGIVACDVCDGDAPPWTHLRPDEVPDPERLVDLERVVLQAVAWTASYTGGRYGEASLLAAIAGNETLGEGRPIGAGLLNCPQFGAARYIRGSERRLKATVTALIAAGELQRDSVTRRERGYTSLSVTDLGYTRLGQRPRGTG